MPEPTDGNSAPTVEPVPSLPLDYRPLPAPPSPRFGFATFCLSIFALAFMATSYSMYLNVLGFNYRPIQLWIAWASIALGGVNILLAPIALYRRRGKREIAAMSLAILYWLVFTVLK